MAAAPPSTPPPALLSHLAVGSLRASFRRWRLPLGGLGAGRLSVNSYGGFQDFAIRHKPDPFGACPTAGFRRKAAFGAPACPWAEPESRAWSRAPIPLSRIYDQGLKAQGCRDGGHEGLPRFAKAAFKAEFPFAQREARRSRGAPRGGAHRLEPLRALETTSPPECPARSSSTRSVNRTRQSVAYDFSFHLSNLGSRRRLAASSRAAARVMPQARRALLQRRRRRRPRPSASAALTVLSGTSQSSRANWFRGGWFDGITALWREISTGTFTANAGPSSEAEPRDGTAARS